MSNYKPFPLVAPTTPWKRGIGVVVPRPVVTVPAEVQGRTMLPRKNGVKGVYLRPGLLAAVPSTLRQHDPAKPLTEAQLNAAHVKWMRAQGWKRAAILQALGVSENFYAAVVREISHQDVAPIEPDMAMPERTAREKQAAHVKYMDETLRLPMTEISKRLGVSYAFVYAVLRGLTYRYVKAMEPTAPEAE